MSEPTFSDEERATILRRLRAMVDEIEGYPPTIWTKECLPTLNVTIICKEGDEYELTVGMDRLRYGRDD